MKHFLHFLTDDDQRLLMESIEQLQVTEGTIILHEGEQRHAIFLVLQGDARVERTHGDFNIEISHLEEGEIFGEMSFVEGFMASANVVAASSIKLAVIESAVIERLSADDPGFSGRFYKSLTEILSRRLRETTTRGISEYTWGGGIRRVPVKGDSDEMEATWTGGSPLRDKAFSA